MGAHPDNGIVHALHKWRTRALKAERELADHKGEALLREVADTAGLFCGAMTITQDLVERIDQHLEGEDS